MINQQLKKWPKISTAWLAYLAGTTLICIPIWVDFGITSASITVGFLLLLASAFSAASNL